MLVLRRLLFDLRYRVGRAPWDTGVTPPEVRAYVEQSSVRPGRSLDLGCGTGTNTVYLARRGWEAVGVDFSPHAIAAARRRARDASVSARARFEVADVTRLPELGSQFDLALDIGCLHSIPRDRRFDYARGLAARLAPGAVYFLYAFCPPQRFGIARDEMASLFAEEMRLESFEQGTGRPSAWYRFKRL